MATYRYLPLKSGDETRLLVLEPGHYDDPLIGQLLHINLNDGPEYEAISYCWANCVTNFAIDNLEKETPVARVVPVNGEPVTEVLSIKFKDMPTHPLEDVRNLYYIAGGPRPSGTLVCDGQRIDIGGELYSALKRFRYQEGRRTLWADALCINQNDLDEKAIQIRNMDRIFGDAQSVLIWLGENSSNVFQAFEVLHDIEDILNEVCRDQDGLGNVVLKYRFKSHKRTMDLHWDALSELLQRAWFGRIWCLQEVVKSRHAMIHIGPFQQPWKPVSEILLFLRYHDLDSDLWARGESLGNHAVTTMCDLIRGGPDLPLLRTLQRSRLFKSTLPSDKVYAIMSLVSPTDRQAVGLDYHISAEDLYKNLATYHIIKNHSLEILYDCFKSSANSSLRVPSWVPDWTQNPYHQGLLYKGHHATASSTTKAHYTISSDKTTLTVRGRIVDTVDRIEHLRPIPWSAVLKDNYSKGGKLTVEERLASKDKGFKHDDGETSLWQSSHKSFFWKRIEHLKRWLGNAVQNIAFPTGEATPEQFEALWRTFMCDQTPDGTRPDAEWGQKFAVWMDISMLGGDKSAEEISRALDEKKAVHGAERVEWDLRKLPGDKNASRRMVEMSENFGAINGEWCYNRRFFRSRQGRFGWCPDGVEVGDRVAVVDGLGVPLVLREVETPGNECGYEVCGDVYLHGVMHGEALEMPLEVQMLRLV